MMHDVIIIGGGPAGLTAGIYAVRRNLKTLLIEQTEPGGQMLLTNEVENWPGEKLISGPDLAKRMKEHARSLGVDFLIDEVLRLELDGNKKIVKTRDKTLEAKVLIIATGGSHRHLDVVGEEDFSGKGVSYCATCDAPFFTDKTVAVIGGGNTAIEDAIYMTSVAKKTYLIHRKGILRAEHARQKVFLDRGGEMVLNSVVEEISGNDVVKHVKIKDLKTGDVKQLDVDGVFISIGVVPVSQLAKDTGVVTNEAGYITVNKRQETNVAGIFAAGDVTGGVHQVATAVGGGCVAGLSAYDFIEKPYWSK